MLIMMGLSAETSQPSPYAFRETIPREVLERYLARSMTSMDLLTGKGNADDNIRVVTETGVV